ncbi:hypothetical protein GTO10_01980 [Candidatus Saccharibacteria bacterium]|nr:hypothetical protein [Candidatus Saccharibacteria bacterium]
MLRNKVKTTAATISALALSATPVLAQAGKNPLRWDSICDAASAITNILFGIAGTIAVIILIMGGIQYMTSGGDKIGVEQARGRITSAVIGLVIVLGAWLIVNVVLRTITPNIPACAV